MKASTPVHPTDVPLLNQLIKTEMVQRNSEEPEPKYFLDDFRNLYIAAKSGELLQEYDSECFNPLRQIDHERQMIVEELVQKFSDISDEEKLLFFLKIPVFGPTTNSYSKLGIFTTRVEIRRTAAWIRSHLEEDNEAAIPKRDVYDKYLEHCQLSRMIPISIADFGKVMKHMYPSVRPRRLGMRGKSQYCYAGMGSCKHVKRPVIYGHESDESECSRMEITAIPDEFGTDPSINRIYRDPSHQRQENDQTDFTVADGEIVPKCPRNCYDVTEDKSLKSKKSAACQKARRKFSQARSLKELNLDSMEQPLDGQLEDEVAQYFRSNEFRTPMKLVKGSDNRCSAENRFFSSREIPSVERCQSSIDGCWPTYESPLFRRSNSHNDAVTPQRSISRLATEQLANLQLTSVLSRASSNDINPNGCGFTPISPSPVPWANLKTIERPHSQVYDESKSDAAFRPRGYSLNDVKYNLKRDFQKAFDHVEIEAQQGDTNSEQTWLVSNVIQNIDCLHEKTAPLEVTNVIPEFHGNQPQLETEMTCQELTEILANSIAEENNSFEVGKIGDGLMPEDDITLPQLENMFADIKRNNEESGYEPKMRQENFSIEAASTSDQNDPIVASTRLINRPVVANFCHDFNSYY